MIGMADGDGRYFLNMLEEVFAAVPEGRSAHPETLARTVQKRLPLYDKAADGHYNLISAFAGPRGSDPDAALYYLARMLVAGRTAVHCAPGVRMAIEDGAGGPGGRAPGLAAKETYDFLGSPEGELATQAVVYVATAPKSNALYSAFKGAMERAKQTGLACAAQDHRTRPPS